MKKINPLVALTGAALALPAIAADQPTSAKLSFLSSTYHEKDIKNSTILSGAGKRYDIEKNQFRLVTPLGENWSGDLYVSQEAMSGASPWGTFDGADDESSLIMSGATIRDKRTQVNLSGRKYNEDSSYGFTLTRSKEDDYSARGFGVSGEWDLNNKLSTVSAGFSLSDDEIKPVDALKFGRIEKGKKQTRSFAAGWTQIINQNSILFTGISHTMKQGLLSDPYKLRDTRPSKKAEWTLSFKYRQYFENRNAALHADYRLYNDDFGVTSHTAGIAWKKSIGDKLKIAPRFRYYSQSEADFYAFGDNYSLAKTEAQSSDHRLSGFGSTTTGVQISYELGKWSMKMSFDRYSSKNSLGHAESKKEHPALLDFTLWSAGFDLEI